MPVSDLDRRRVRMALTRYYGLDPETEIVDIEDDGHELVALVRLPVLREDLPPAEDASAPPAANDRWRSKQP